jgi:hypothetical protein
MSVLGLLMLVLIFIELIYVNKFLKELINEIKIKKEEK